MRKGTAVLVLALLVVPILAAPAHAWGMAFHGGGGGFGGFAQVWGSAPSRRRPAAHLLTSNGK